MRSTSEGSIGSEYVNRLKGRGLASERKRYTGTKICVRREGMWSGGGGVVVVGEDITYQEDNGASGGARGIVCCYCRYGR